MLDHSHSDGRSVMSVDEDDSTHHSGGSGSTKNAAEIAYAKRQRYLAISRCASLLMVLAFAAAAGAATYVLTSNQQEEATASQVR
jgi:hypothetical protein